MNSQFLNITGLQYLINLIKNWGQPKLENEINIKTISSGDQNVSILGSGSLQFKTIGDLSVIGSDNIEFKTISSGDQNVSILGSGSLQFKTIGGMSLIGDSDIKTVTINNENIFQDKNISLQTPLSFSGGTGLSVTNKSGKVTYSMNVATPDTIGGVSIGFTSNDKNYAIQLDENNKAYVNVPWVEYSVVSEKSNGLAPIITGETEATETCKFLIFDGQQPKWSTVPKTAFEKNIKIVTEQSPISLNWGTESLLMNIDDVPCSIQMPNNPLGGISLTTEQIQENPDQYMLILKIGGNSYQTPLQYMNPINNEEIIQIVQSAITPIEN